MVRAVTVQAQKRPYRRYRYTIFRSDVEEIEGGCSEKFCPGAIEAQYRGNDKAVRNVRLLLSKGLQLPMILGVTALGLEQERRD